jgi:trimeric autotransporter adhesin
VSKISLAPDASGSGIFTIASPNSNTNRTLTLPDDTGTLALTSAALTGTTDSGTPFETALGSGAGAANTGANNTFIGFEAGNDNTTGIRNTALGYNALSAVTTANENTAVGFNALAVSTAGDSVAVGSSALQANTTGAENTALGAGALKANTTGASNTAVGRAALNVNTTGANNTAVGYQALDAATTATQNTAVGMNALGATTTAGDNTSVGYGSLSSNTTGASNTAVGSFALLSNTTGYFNTAVGKDSLGSNTTGFRNTCLGINSGDAITTGSFNICIGNLANPSTASGTDQIVLGYNINGQANTNVTIGNNNGKIYNAYTVNATWTQTSDERLKKNIQEDTLGLSFINRLRPVKYQWKPSNEIDPSLPYYNEQNTRDIETVMHGLVAQEVKAALDAEGVTTFAGWDVGSDTIQAVSREMFVSPLIKAIQELSAQVTALQAEINTLKGQ